MAFEPVTWTDLVNCIASPDLNDLTKNAGVAGNWDAGAISSQQIALALEGTGIEFSLMPGAAAGLSADNPDQDYQTIDFCIMKGWGDIFSAYIYENGVYIDTIGIYNKYRILINASGQIEYWYYDASTDTWTLFYTSLVSPSFPLFMDTSINQQTNPPQVYYALINTGVIAKIDHLPLMGVH